MSTLEGVRIQELASPEAGPLYGREFGGVADVVLLFANCCFLSIDKVARLLVVE